jgi:hypothetical protein
MAKLIGTKAHRREIPIGRFEQTAVRFLLANQKFWANWMSTNQKIFGCSAEVKAR